jgi:hypothetical protein
MPNGRQQSLLLSPWLYATVLVAGLVAINLILFTGAYNGEHVDPDKAGVLGDFVGGYVGSYIALLGGMGLLYTLALQRELLQQQESEARRQHQEDATQRFEAKYFELIRLHRENVAEMQFGRNHGRKVFPPILNEIRFAAAIVRNVAKDCSHDISDFEAVRVAYTAVFFGVGTNASPMLTASLSKQPASFIGELDAALRDAASKKRDRMKRERRRGRVPFQGHQSRLGHYYRHLFQAIKYVDSHELTNKLGDDAKRAYAKTIRAQLSTHEQALLLLNALSDVGREWWDQKYLTSYGLVKNLPRDFLASMRLDMGQLFKRDYFEWEQNSAGPLVSDTGQVIAQ